MKKKINSKEKLILHSFEELGEINRRKPRNIQTKNKEKLESQRKRMSGTCRVCGHELRYVPGTNIFYCANSECKGYERTKIDENGNEIKISEQVYRMVDERGVRIASVLFDEKN